jgi:hypothetical protein
MIFTSIERKDKFLAPKLDSLLKHVDCWKCKVSMPRVDVSSYSMNKNFAHSKNEKQYTIVKDLLSWAYSSVILFVNTNINMSNLLFFITSLLMVIQWLILKASKFYSKCSKWRMLEGKIEWFI